MLEQGKQDLIYNALLVGMEIHDAYIFAGLSEEEIEEVSANDELQAQWATIAKRFEFNLLQKLNKVIETQVHLGKESAITWMLAHSNPRYADKAIKTDLPDLHLHIDAADPATMDTVEIHGGVDDTEQ